MEVHIKVPAIRVEPIEDKTNSSTRIEMHDETTVVITRRVTGNPNFDAYLQPTGDVLYNFIGGSGTFSYGGIEFRPTDKGEITFDCYANEIREAAQKRAGEDSTDELTVLDDWMRRAQNHDHDGVTNALSRAIGRAEDPQ